MKIFHDSAPCLLHLLLLAELFALSSARPAHRSSLCHMFRSMIHQVDKLMTSSKQLHGLTDVELSNFEGVENNLDDLPHIIVTAEHLTTLKVNESLSQLLNYTESFKLHVDWLKTAKENLSMSSHSAGGTSTHLLQLSKLIRSSLEQIGEEVPPSPSASLPVVSSAFEALQFSVEISERLQVFGHWSKRVLRLLTTQSRCPRH
ncbi:uncharacterized protein LOC121524544 [Xyrichtys novacula]|uniref:Uncharacterized protein LOC121524544 n=1 Tax=Xyrichtys novacula TaxID=13765 RepID=A0AAV1HAX9_XYRNO|nr:uncharacterized protein LOC121524544 [Xyrichtys novacula]